MPASPSTTCARRVAEPIALQEGFDPLPVELPARWLDRLSRPVRFLDTGPPDGQALIFFGGLGTSVGACQLTEFARSTRERLRLRLISVERAGFGLTPVDPSWGYAEAAADALAVLDALGVERYRIVAISGGGPYAAALAAAAPGRVVSLHFAATAAGPPIGRTVLDLMTPERIAVIVRDPEAWWRYPPESPVHGIPGLAAAMEGEGRRALSADAAAALAQEWRRLCCTPLSDLSGVLAPAYLYWGTADEVVSPEHAAAWARTLPNVVALRQYPGEGHDVQYRHWDQILLDASGFGAGRILLCRDRETWLVAEEVVPEWLAAGASLGLCCWSGRAGG